MVVNIKSVSARARAGSTTCARARTSRTRSSTLLCIRIIYIFSLASKTLSPLLFCYAEFYGRGEGSSNSCNIPCAAAHYRKPQCGLACGRYVNSYVMTSVMNIIITQRSTLYCVTPLYRIASRYITNEQQEFLRRALIGQFKPQLRNHGILLSKSC